MFFTTFKRAFRQIGSEKKLALTLVAANSMLAFSQFAEPILFGRVIDHLSTPGIPGASVWDPALVKIIAAWIGFGLTSCRPPVPSQPASNDFGIFRTCADTPARFS